MKHTSFLNAALLRIAGAAFLFSALSISAPVHAGTGSVIPALKAETLNKTKIDIPQGFSAAHNVLLFSFGRDMQKAVDEWDAALTSDRDGTNVQVYNMPVIPNPGALVRGFISGGMRDIYKDKDLRDRVIVLYVDEKTYMPALGVTDKTAPLIVITDKAGVEIGRVQSVLNPEALAAVRSTLKQ